MQYTHMLNIYIARHGQDADNQNNILNGHRDEPLTCLGMEQARKIADKIKNAGLTFDVIYSSPLKRTFETAKIISETINAPFLIKEDLLIERDLGIMTGRKISDIEAMCAPDIIRTETVIYFLHPEGAETFQDLTNRANDLLKKLQAIHKSGNILLLCHGDIGKMIYAAYYNLNWKTVLTQFHFDNCDLLLLSEDSPAENSHILKVNCNN
jgi:probable phosphoglycerate mutase